MVIDFKNLTETEKKEMIERAYNIAYEYEQTNGNCPQCVIAAIHDVFNIPDDKIYNEIFKLSYGFGAGVGATSLGNCGALTGAIILIGVLQGREFKDFENGKNAKCYELSREIIKKFEDKYDGILCNQVQKSIMGQSYNLSNEDEFVEFEKAGGHVDKCPSVVGFSAKLIAEMIVNGEI